MKKEIVPVHAYKGPKLAANGAPMNSFAHLTPPANDLAQSDRVDFSIRRNGLSVSASAPTHYFDEHVLPIVASLLQEIGTRTDGRSAGAGTGLGGHPREAKPDKFSSMSVKTVAQKISARNAPQILKAAAISLRVLQNREQFTGEELLEEAQLAHGFWKKSHAQSADRLLEYLVSSGILIETFDGRYALSSREEDAAMAILS